jgi:hypothetical protein
LTADANGVGTWQQPGGGGRYDSGWFAIGSNSSRTLEHNLGTTGLYWEIWAASDASGSNKNRQVYTSARYGSAMTGAYITVINANSFKLQTGNHWWSGAPDYNNWSHARVIAEPAHPGQIVGSALGKMSGSSNRIEDCSDAAGRITYIRLPQVGSWGGACSCMANTIMAGGAQGVETRFICVQTLDTP